MHGLPRNWNTLIAKFGLSKRRLPREKNSGAFYRALRMEALEDRRALAITVNTFVDERDGNITTDGDVSLRDAIEQAPDGETINFDPSLDEETITLLHGLAFGEIEIGKNLTIDASALPNGITINANDPTGNNPDELLNDRNNGDGIRIFNITDPPGDNDVPHVTLIGLTLTNADPEIVGLGPEGGAIRSEARLTLRDMHIRKNGAGFGAAVYLAVPAAGFTARDVLVIEDSTIEHNSALGDGGGVYIRFASQNTAPDKVRILGSELSHNKAGASGSSAKGGALHIDRTSFLETTNTVIIDSSKLSINTAPEGGAISNQGGGRLQLILQESEISGNTAVGSGGGVYFKGFEASHLQVSRSVITGNTATEQSGGGLFVELNQVSSCTIEDSTISGNSATHDGGGVRVKVNAISSGTPLAPRSLTIARSVISGNTTKGRGGGLYIRNLDNAESLVVDAHITGNVVPESNYRGNGGGFYAYLQDSDAMNGKAKITISRSTVDNNQTGSMGGGVFVCSKFNGDFVAVNSTFSHNRTLDEVDGAGGGFLIARFDSPDEFLDAYLRNVTVTQNISANGGGVGMKDLSDIRVRIANSIISENFADNGTSPSNLVGRIVVGEFKHNLIGNGVQARDVNGVIVLQDSPSVNTIPLGNNNIPFNDAPLLGPLLNHGGRTPTHSLKVGSQAIDAGSNDLSKMPLTGPPEEAFLFDQRGDKFARHIPVPGVGNDTTHSVDIGAYEVNPAKVVDVIISNSSPNAAHAPYRFSDAFADHISQFRTVPVGGADTIAVVFSESVLIDKTDLWVVSGYAGINYTANWNVIVFTYDPDTFTATWKFPTDFPAEKLEIGFNVNPTTQVFGAYGHLLDGEWSPVTGLSTPPSSFTSGNYYPGGVFRFRFVILPGDIDLDNDVDGSDFLLWQQMAGGGTDRTFTEGDFDGDGDVDGDDLYIVDLQNSGLAFYTW